MLTPAIVMPDPRFHPPTRFRRSAGVPSATALLMVVSGGLAPQAASATIPQEMPPGLWPSGLDPAAAAEADRILAEFGTPEGPGVLVAVVRSGEIVFERALGMANLGHSVPLTPDTRTNIGSTGKQFTAFAIALLEREGRLSLDDDVRLHLPELPDFGEAVTLRHLLTHTSGYREYLNALAIGGWRIEDSDYIGREEAVRVVQRQPELQNVPGAEWNYNNTGYLLLSLVVERLSGRPFPEWMRENVFEPAGMTSTLVRRDPWQIVPDAAYGYLPGEDGAFRHAGDLGSAMGAGAVYTTLGDLARWMHNLSTGSVGGPGILESMTTPFVLATGTPTTYGLGLEIDREGGLERIHHPGGDLAHRSHFAYFPELDAGIIVLSNHGGLSGTLAGQLTRAFFGEEMEARVAAADGEAPAPGVASHRPPYDLTEHDAVAFDRFLGRYELQPGFVLTFRRDGKRIRGQATAQPAFEMIPTSDTTYTIAGVDAHLTFHAGEGGEATGVTLHQNGDHFARRLPEPGVAPVDLGAFEGRYFSAEFENVYTIEVDGRALVVTQRRRDPIRLVHTDGDTFTGPFPLVQVSFERDGRGVVSGLRAGNVRARDIYFEKVQ